MVTELNKEMVSKFFNEVMNNKNLGLIKDIFSPNYRSHAMDGKGTYGIQDFVPFLTYLFKAFPDIHYTIDHIMAAEDMVALDLTATGTHGDEFLGYPVSLKKIKYKEMYFFRICDNKIVERWGLQDLAGIKEQISKY